MTYFDASAAGDTSASTLTPDMQSLKVGKKRGRPRADPKPPTYDDFPATGSKEEQDAWKRKKTTEAWRYKQKTGPNAAQFRASENVRGKSNYRKRKLADELEGDGNEVESKKERSRELSRQR